jgi:hypothetical protein
LIQITTCYFDQAAGRHVVSNGGRMQSLVLLATITFGQCHLAGCRAFSRGCIELRLTGDGMGIHRNGALGHHLPDFRSLAAVKLAGK